MTATRLTLLRGGYLFMGIGLVLVKWPQLADAADLPLYEGVTLCLLVAMSVLALLGVFRPIAMLPVLVFESLWKLLWLGIVGLPQAVGGDLDSATSDVLFSCCFVVVILAAVPWRYVWREYVRTDVKAAR